MVGLLVCAAALAGPPASARADSARDRVSVLIAAPDADAAKLSEVLAELLARIEADSDIQQTARIDPARVVTPVEDAPAALARVFIDATASDVAVLYLVDSAWERILVRRVPLSAGLDEVAREQLAHIVESSVAALRAGGRIGVGRQEVERELGLAAPPRETAPPEKRPAPRTRPAPAQTPIPARRERGLAFALGVGWAAALFTSEHLMHGPVARADAELAGHPIWGAALTGQYRLPLVIESEPIDVRLESGSARALLTAKLPLSPAWRVLGEAGGGVDVERVVSQGDRSVGLEVASSEVRVSPIARLGLGPAARVVGAAWLAAIVALELDLAPDDFVVRRGATTEVVAEPLALRPGVTLVLTAPLAGP